MKPRIAIVRGKFLNKYEMQMYEPLVGRYDITAFGSRTPYHDVFAFPTVKLPSPMDIPEFPWKMPILNRLFIDAHYLWGLEEKLVDFDIVHTAETYFHYTQQCLNARRAGRVKKVIATVLENIAFNNEGIWGRKVYKERARQELDHIVALTEKSKDALVLEGCDPAKITVISHFVDTKRFVPSPGHMGRIGDPKRRELHILFTGRIEVYKGIYDLLEAARRLLIDPELRNFRLMFHLVGGGSESLRVQALEKKLGIESSFVHFHVSYDRMPAVYEAADIFVAPSEPTPTWEEQYCTALLEAQAAGLPIVTTKTGGIPENIADAGIMVEPGDIDALTTAIKGFIVDPDLRVQFARRARTRAVRVHDSRIGANKLDHLYRSLLT